MTLFLDDEVYTKIRNFDIPSRFMSVDDLREKGNKAYHEKNFRKAIVVYTQALSLLEWLEYLDLEGDEECGETFDMMEKSPSTDVGDDDYRQKLDDLEDQMSKVDIDLNSVTTDLLIESKRKVLGLKEGQGLKGEFKESAAIKPELRKYMTSFNDNNVRLAKDDQCVDESDISMSKKPLPLQIMAFSNYNTIRKVNDVQRIDESRLSL